MKVVQPKLAETVNYTGGLCKAIEDAQKKEINITGYKFQDETLQASASLLEFEQCFFENMSLTGSELYKTSFTDVMFKGCDLSNTCLRENLFHRVSFMDCKGIGADFSEAYMTNTSFQDCRFRYANLFRTTLKKVVFKNIKMPNGAMGEMKLKDVEFSDCDFTESEFFRTSLDGIDLTTCNISGIHIGIQDLQGLIVSQSQAVDLSRLMGLKIKF